MDIKYNIDIGRFCRWLPYSEPRGASTYKQCIGAAGGHSRVEQRQSQATTQI